MKRRVCCITIVLYELDVFLVRLTGVDDEFLFAQDFCHHLPIFVVRFLSS